MRDKIRRQSQVFGPQINAARSKTGPDHALLASMDKQAPMKQQKMNSWFRVDA
jgi:hypothetical protein